MFLALTVVRFYILLGTELIYISSDQIDDPLKS